MGKKTGRNRAFWDSARINNLTYKQYYDRLVELSCLMFDWQGLPASLLPSVRYCLGICITRQ